MTTSEHGYSKGMAMTTRRVEVAPDQHILIGAKLGESERARLQFDELDNSSDDVDVIVKIGTPAVLSDFISALVGPSVRLLGFKRFAEKYRFDASPGVRESILENARIEERMLDPGEPPR